MKKGINAYQEDAELFITSALLSIRSCHLVLLKMELVGVAGGIQTNGAHDMRRRRVLRPQTASALRDLNAAKCVCFRGGRVRPPVARSQFSVVCVFKQTECGFFDEDARVGQKQLFRRPAPPTLITGFLYDATAEKAHDVLGCNVTASGLHPRCRGLVPPPSRRPAAKGSSCLFVLRWPPCSLTSRFLFPNERSCS